MGTAISCPAEVCSATRGFHLKFLETARRPAGHTHLFKGSRKVQVCRPSHLSVSASVKMTSPLPQLQPLTASIRDLATYPENLVHKTIYPDALKTYKYNLDDIEKSVFVSNDDDVNVPFRDLIDSGQGTSGPGPYTLAAIGICILRLYSIRKIQSSQ